MTIEYEESHELVGVSMEGLECYADGCSVDPSTKTWYKARLHKEPVTAVTDYISRSFVTSRLAERLGLEGLKRLKEYMDAAD